MNTEWIRLCQDLERLGVTPQMVHTVLSAPGNSAMQKIAAELVSSAQMLEQDAARGVRDSVRDTVGRFCADGQHVLFDENRVADMLAHVWTTEERAKLLHTWSGLVDSLKSEMGSGAVVACPSLSISQICNIHGFRNYCRVSCDIPVTGWGARWQTLDFAHQSADATWLFAPTKIDQRYVSENLRGRDLLVIALLLFRGNDFCLYDSLRVSCKDVAATFESRRGKLFVRFSSL